MRPQDRDLTRRTFLRAGTLALAALAAGTHTPLEAAAPLAREGDPDPLTGIIEPARKVVRAHFGDRPIRAGHVTMDTPETAPDGRQVPIFIDTDLPQTSTEYVKALHLIVDHNPDIYLAGYWLTPATGGASIDTRIKMRRSSYVRVIAETNRGELWGTAKFVYVTLNGCV
ncbi:MAG TPA: thiosulfate oxidation carrier protein SoxY [Gemmatimonadaceae bacterium]